MAGTQAGTLYIEILADIARLEKDLQQAKKAVGQASSQISKDAIAANDNIRKMGTGMAYTGRMSRSLRANMLNLSRQGSDVAQGFALGQAPMQIFLQQGFQISEVLATMKVDAEAAGTSLTRTLLPAIGKLALRLAPVIAIVGAATAGFKLFQGEVEKSGELQKYAEGLGLTKDEMEELGHVGVTVGDVFKGVYRTFDDYLGLTEIFNTVKNVAVQAFDFMLRAGKTAAAGIYSAFVGSYNAVRELFRAIMSGDFSGAGQRIVAGYRDAFNSANTGLSQFGTDLSANIRGAARDRLSASANEIIGDRKGSKAKNKALDELTKAYQKAFQAAQNFRLGILQETEELGKTALEVRTMRAEKEALAAIEAAKAQKDPARIKALMDEAEAIRAAEKAYQDKFKAQQALDAAKENAAIAKDIARQKQELELLSLTGVAREMLSIAIEEQAEIEAILVEVQKAEAEGNVLLANQLRQRIELIRERYAVERQGVGIADQLKRDAEAAEILNNQLRDMIGLLGNLGGVGQGIGALLGIFTGNTSAVGGVLGDLLNSPTGKLIDEIGPDGKKTGKMIGQTIGDELSGFFDRDSDFGKAMSGLLGAAGDGLVIGNALFGRQSATEQIGSAIGAAAGSAIGSQFGPAGAAAGKVVGAFIGDFVGGLFTSTPRGSATIGGVNGALGVTGTRGNSSARIAAATDSANSIIGGLEALAAELGATIDPSRGSVSIGVRKGNFRVDTSGQGRTKTSKGAIDFGEDAEAAAYFAMLDLIKDGVLVGLRKGTETLLKNSQDLEAGIAKALQFEGVFRELAELKDPLGAALDSLEKEFEQLRKVFAEAGATAEEYAQLEELLSLKRQEAIDRENERFISDQRDRIDLEVEILRLLGREQEALNLARETELAGMKATLRPLQQMIYTLQDARVIMDQFEPLAASLRAFKEELLGTVAPNNFAFLRGQFQSTAASARDGDAAALARLQQVSSEYLEAAKGNAGSALEYQRAVGEVLGAVDDGIFAADAQIEYAQMQIDAINAQTDILQGLIEKTNAMQEQMVAQGEWTERMFRRWDGDGLLVRNDADTPVYTQEIV